MDDTDRNSLEGMKFAVLDLFCLSKTNKIIGSVGSSYSQIAAEIGGIEVEYANKQQLWQLNKCYHTNIRSQGLSLGVFRKS